jgi:hypothetical protein
MDQSLMLGMVAFASDRQGLRLELVEIAGVHVLVGMNLVGMNLAAVNVLQLVRQHETGMVMVTVQPVVSCFQGRLGCWVIDDDVLPLPFEPCTKRSRLPCLMVQLIGDPAQLLSLQV